LIRECIQLAASNPEKNLLLLADLYPPHLSLSKLFVMLRKGRVTDFSTTYRAFSNPSIVLGTKVSTKTRLLHDMLSRVRGSFACICEPKELELFKDKAKVVDKHYEYQMILEELIKRGELCGEGKVELINRHELGKLDHFLRENGAPAWLPVQFDSGPYYCVKQQDEIVSVAGVHFVTPQIAQLGNILTAEPYRGRGYATQCTYALTSALHSRSILVSLFVVEDNKQATWIYEKIGFRKRRRLVYASLHTPEVR
jgi:ribosomal protein S18 acetylase RimI-like enzyme